MRVLLRCGAIKKGHRFGRPLPPLMNMLFHLRNRRLFQTGYLRLGNPDLFRHLHLRFAFKETHQQD